MRSVLALSLGLIAACTKPEPIGGACKVTSQCSKGLFCLHSSRKCSTTQCATAADCGGGQSCSAVGSCTTEASGAGSPQITGAALSSTGVLTLSGTNLNAISGLQVTGGTPAVMVTLTPGNGTTSLTATAQTALKLVVGQTYNLLVSTANATTPTTVPITVSMPADAVTTDGANGSTTLAAALGGGTPPLIVVKSRGFFPVEGQTNANSDPTNPEYFYCRTTNDAGNTDVSGCGTAAGPTGNLPASNATYSNIAFVPCDPGYLPIGGGCNTLDATENPSSNLPAVMTKNCLATPTDCNPATGSTGALQTLSATSQAGTANTSGWGCRAQSASAYNVFAPNINFYANDVWVTVTCLKVQ